RTKKRLNRDAGTEVLCISKKEKLEYGVQKAWNHVPPSKLLCWHAVINRVQESWGYTKA
ncbi:hypothetical protein M747DRAFT_250111, partial [Aspergillus niger ATCC 13496]